MYQNLLITGGCGFIGSNFINYYFYKNTTTNIYNIDALYYCASKDNILEEIRNSSRYHFIEGKIQSRDLIKYILNEYHIDAIINFAAQTHVQNSFDGPSQFVYDNIVGTHNLLLECKIYGKIKKFIHVSTDEVYGESQLHENSQKTESSILCPTNPYAASKASAELLVRSYYYSYNFPIIITRSNNIYGPNQYPEKLIPLFIKQLKKSLPVTIQGDGSNLRSFVHAYDISKAFELILNKGTIGETYNIGGSHEYSVMDIAKILISLIKNTEDFEKWIEYIPNRPYNDKRYFINDNKIKQLGWNQQISLLDGIKQLI
ncbi:MAG: dTDP-D-glucose 4,6-dehydratase/N-acetylglucosamine-1-phosphate urydiltransferase fusion protein [Satyrvirus sp.]|uniref:dTDP-D-glucose 4,6-dehydratase/N-acetylglucosamine-1-phosphate urydiltransferase fusion protein n=1 Tax=Satyrvirus sp. TaxID=2487771 RepID=A0A3G5AIV2_9VIRU|nr:MAG: dTDP-D-glucose 4,6-dehydratase/N-acetylglucosamine-1-phosphate urydiltransferase fusion protein [Satyrvirus sp.]